MTYNSSFSSFRLETNIYTRCLTHDSGTDWDTRVSLVHLLPLSLYLLCLESPQLMPQLPPRAGLRLPDPLTPFSRHSYQKSRRQEASWAPRTGPRTNWSSSSPALVYVSTCLPNPQATIRQPPTDTTLSQQPFKNDYPRNPSWDIAASLPTYLPIVNAKAPSALRATELPPVRIVVHPEPVRVTYSAVRELIPRLWKPEFSGVPRIDFVLHIGMASPRPQYVLEQVGDRDGYTLRDLDNTLPAQDPSRADWPWVGVPSQLTTELDVVDVRARWEQHLPVGV